MVWIVAGAALRSDVHHVSRRRSWRRRRTRASSSASSMRRPTRPSTRPQATRKQPTRRFIAFPETDFTFQITFPATGFGGMVVKPWGERKRTAVRDPAGSCRRSCCRSRASACSRSCRPALPGGGRSRSSSSSPRPPSRSGSSSSPKSSRAKRPQSGLFAFPPIIDVKIDQPQAELVIDRDKVAALGLNIQQVGADLAAMVGGNFVNRFNIDGRSYKVIPQIERAERLNPDQLEAHLRHRARTDSSFRSARSRRSRTRPCRAR